MMMDVWTSIRNSCYVHLSFTAMTDNLTNYLDSEIETMKKLLLILFFVFNFNAQAQQKTPLREPESVYEKIENASKKIKIEPSSNPVILLSKSSENKISSSANAHLNESEIVALLLIENGEIAFEGYGKGSSSNNRFASLSMAKSLVSLAIGEALCVGKINSLDDRADKYSKELEGLPIGKTSIKNLLQMNSGIKTTTAFSGLPYANAGTDLLLRKTNHIEILKKYASEVGSSSRFVYSNMDTDALNYVIRGATGVSLSEWMQTTIIQKAGFESPSFWAVDNQDVEIAASFYYATVRDWARLALYIENYLLDGKESCMREYLKTATSKQIEAQTHEFNDYGYQFFINPKIGPKSSFWLVGFGGQRIAFNIEKRKIMINFAWSHETKKTFNFFDYWSNN